MVQNSYPLFDSAQEDHWRKIWVLTLWFICIPYEHIISIVRSSWWICWSTSTFRDLVAPDIIFVVFADGSLSSTFWPILNAIIIIVMCSFLAFLSTCWRTIGVRPTSAWMIEVKCLRFVTKSSARWSASTMTTWLCKCKCVLLLLVTSHVFSHKPWHDVLLLLDTVARLLNIPYDFSPNRTSMMRAVFLLDPRVGVLVSFSYFVVKRAQWHSHEAAWYHII